VQVLLGDGEKSIGYELAGLSFGDSAFSIHDNA
jgi:hypothetical protein